MSTTRTGRDGRPLVTTAMAAYSLGGWSPSRFRTWAARHGIAPTAYQPNPNRGQAVALWDLTDITQALDNKRNAA